MKLIDILDENDESGIWREKKKPTWFQKGDISDREYSKHIVTDSDEDKKSVSWDIKREIKEEELLKDISSIIIQLEIIRLKKYKSRDRVKLEDLIRDIKSFKNRFTRLRLDNE